ncbi:MAG: glutamate cyclase domain-containing protein [Deltaproteobacteria bacterium]
MTSNLIRQFEDSIRRDPAQRGLIASEPRYGPLCPGHLGASATHLARFGKRVSIVTGFFIPAGDPPAAETDGPPGALVLAQTLLALGIDSLIVTDAFCFSALAAAARSAGYPPERLIRYPDPIEVGSADDATAAWRSDFFERGPGENLSHLIAVERVGPSHTAQSVARQPRGGEAPLARFLERVPPADRDHCHNMRGEKIDHFAGDMHRLFEEAPVELPGVKTIGIGDGANEIGMGAVPWEDLERRLSGEQSGRVPCRIATDWNIIAGTSNWGAYALAASVALLRGAISAVAPFDCRQQQAVLQAMVEHGPAVDGVTRRREPTVDGLPFLTYIQPWEAIRAKLGLAE